jgi:hypothetical protein
LLGRGVFVACRSSELGALLSEMQLTTSKLGSTGTSRLLSTGYKIWWAKLPLDLDGRRRLHMWWAGGALLHGPSGELVRAAVGRAMHWETDG